LLKAGLVYTATLQLIMESWWRKIPLALPIFPLSNRFRRYAFSDRKALDTQVLPDGIRRRSDGALLFTEEPEGVVS